MMINNNDNKNNNVLVHMLRNSVDHGVEKSEVREERGKSLRETLL